MALYKTDSMFNVKNMSVPNSNQGQDFGTLESLINTMKTSPDIKYNFGGGVDYSPPANSPTIGQLLLNHAIGVPADNNSNTAKPPLLAAADKPLLTSTPLVAAHLPSITNTDSSKKPVEVEKPLTNDKILDNISNRQKAVEVGKGGADIENIIGELNRREYAPYKSPVYSFTPAQSTRDRDLTEGNQMIDSSVAQYSKMLQENGVLFGTPGIMAQALNGKNKLMNDTANRELILQLNNSKGLNDYRDKQSTANTQGANINIDKQMKENAISGKNIAVSSDRLFNRLTDINQEDYNTWLLHNYMKDKNNYVGNFAEGLLGDQTKK